MPRPAVRLFLVRHGEVDANIQYRFLGRRDDPLNASGREQAANLAALFAELPVSEVYTSPLSRTRDTAEAIAAAAGAELVQDDLLVELDFGTWEGLTLPQIAERGDQDRELLARWESDPSCPAPGGESLADVQERVVRFADQVLEARPGATIAVVTHMGPIKALLCAALEVALTGARRLFLDPATVSVVDWSSVPVVRLFNAHAHLEWRRARWMQKPPPGGR
jgi:probable phosphoglycerate mutase